MDESRLLLLNTSTEMLSDLFLVQVREGEMAITPIDGIAAQSSTTAEIGKPQPLAAGRRELAGMMRQALVRSGLFEDEAAAMVKTWDDSWFAENGVRVLYILPSAWADRILPLALTPAPRQIARVFVGRAEVHHSEYRAISRRPKSVAIQRIRQQLWPMYARLASADSSSPPSGAWSHSIPEIAASARLAGSCCKLRVFRKSPRP
jgi:hypothetical protein